ncbi:MAG: DNA repair protein RadC [Elusimicrobia bacterium]|nr:DNA repair protein RadC [Elusimicrobiota bacterium]
MNTTIAAPLKSSSAGHRRRLRRRLENGGLNGFQDYEILEILLTYAIARKDTKPPAKALLQEFKSLAGVFDAGPKELERVPGIGPRAAQLLGLIKNVAGAYLKNRIEKQHLLNNPAGVADYCRLTLAGKGHELVLALFLDARNRLIAEKTVGQGTIDQAPVYPRRIVEEALSCRASGLILVHNHPSGQPDPSLEDKALTRKIARTAQALDLRFLDHIIVGREGYFSFRESNFFEETSA